MRKNKEILKNITIYKWSGTAAFVIGVIIAITAGAKLPENNQTYPVTLPYFIFGVILSVIGLVVWRINLKKIISITIKNQKAGSKDNPVTLLKNALSSLKKLEKKLNKVTTTSLCEEIDKILDDYILPFAEVRKDVVNIFGMSMGAEILVTVAYGERMLNRVWSASSDGHLTEARNVYSDVVMAMEEALEIVKSNEKAVS